jgi:hypothetical protein
LKQLLLLILIAIVAVSLLPVRQTENVPFASPAFQRLWSIQPASAARSIDLWGSEPLLWRLEPYADLPDGRRKVQYFERGRMELGANPNEVTQGLLALELTTGRIFLGRDLYESRPPPDISIDGGQLDDRVPTYLTLSHLVREPAEDLTDTRQVMNQWIDQSGEVVTGPAPRVTRAARYVPATGHNLPDVTVELFDSPAFSQIQWVDAFGYPVSEPYWTNYRRGDGMTPALIQVFERRILVYTPEYSPDNQFTVTNIGRHYYRWRYNAEPTTELPEPALPERSSRVVVPDGYRAGIYADDFGVPVGMALGPTGHLWVVTQDGRILRAVSDDPDGHPRELVLWADGLLSPRGMVIDRDRVLVTVDDGVLELRDTDRDGVADERSYITQAIAPVAGPGGKPALDGSHNVFAVVADDSDHARLSLLSEPDQPIVVNDLIEYPGALLFYRSNLYVVSVVSENGTSIYHFQAPVTSLVQATPEIVLSFPQDATINALTVPRSDLWPNTRPGAVFAAAEIDGRGSVYRMEYSRFTGMAEFIEFATGFRKPVAMVFGLDGSLYVADAERREIVRIVHTR